MQRGDEAEVQSLSWRGWGEKCWEERQVLSEPCPGCLWDLARTIFKIEAEG